MAKKKKKKKKNLTREKRKQKLLKKVRELDPDAQLTWGSEDNKLSEQILSFAEPLLERCASNETKKRALSVAILAWNISLLPEKDSAKFKSDVIKELCKKNTQDYSDVAELFDYLLERKKLFFDDDKRFVFGYNFTETKDGGFHLDVAYPTLKGAH